MDSYCAQEPAGAGKENEEMSYGTYRVEGRPIQVAPCDEEGDTSHLLYEDCPCEPQWELTPPFAILVHQDVLYNPWEDEFGRQDIEE